jgi:hypothetical protein
VILNCGIHEKDGTAAKFYVNKRISEWSSFIKEVAGRNNDELFEVLIPCRTLSSIILEYGNPYYVKIDIEGNDHIALQSLLGLNMRIPYISVENGGKMLKDLQKQGYDMFKFIQQKEIYQTRLPYPPLEGKFIKHNFKIGASGPFGEETNGQWVNYKKAYVKISRVWNIETGEKNPEWDDLKDGWFDLHARHSKYKEIIHALFHINTGP